MVNAISQGSVQKGFDPREFSLVAFGGGGPLYGVDIARELSIPRVVVPLHPGITSAMGLLASDLKHETQRTVMVDAPSADPAALERVFAEMEAAGRARLDADGVAAGARVLQRLADCRYVGQAYELLVPVPADPSTPPASPRSPAASRRPTSASTSTVSRRSRCRSSTCARTRSG